MGFVLFALFYWALPAWFQAQIDSAKAGNLNSTVQLVIGRRIHWSRLLGITLLLLCSAFSVWNYFRQDRLDPGGERNVGLISRLLARLFQ